MSLADDARRLNLRALRRHGRQESASGATRGPPRRRSVSLPSLILLTDEQRLPDPRTAAARLPRGAAVILRHYGLTEAERAALARDLRAITRRRGALLLIGADHRGAFELARAIGADGLHLSERRLRRGPRHLWRCRKPGWRITAAVHSPVALRLAVRCAVDAVLLSPVFATASHPGARPIGPLRFAAWARTSRIPVYALGGIVDGTAARLRPGPAFGLAGIAAFAAC